MTFDMKGGGAEARKIFENLNEFPNEVGPIGLGNNGPLVCCIDATLLDPHC